MLGQRLENLIFLMSLQSLPYGEMLQGAPRAGTARFVLKSNGRSRPICARAGMTE